VQSALLSRRVRANRHAENRIILSAKVSAVQGSESGYKELASRRIRDPSRPHRGGMDRRHRRLGGGTCILLQDGIATPSGFRSRRSPVAIATLEVQVAQELLQTMGFRTFVPLVAAFAPLRPHHLDHVQELAPHIQDSSATKCRLEDAISSVEALNVAVMAASSTAPANPSTPIFGISLPAPAKPRPRPCSSTARNFLTLRGPTDRRRLSRALVIVISPSATALARKPNSNVTAAE